MSKIHMVKNLRSWVLKHVLFAKNCFLLDVTFQEKLGGLRMEIYTRKEQRWTVNTRLSCFCTHFYWKFTENIPILFVLTCIIIQAGFQESNARSTSLLIYLKIMIMYWYTMYDCSDMRQTLFCLEWCLLKNVGVGGKADVFSNLSFLFKTILSKQCSKENLS